MYQHADLSTIHLICRDLDDIKSMYHITWSKEAEIELLGAQLNIYTFQLQRMSKTQQSSPSRPDNSMLKNALISLGSAAAARVIDLYSTTSASPSTLPETHAHNLHGDKGSTCTHRYLPKYYFQTLMFATSFIFKAMANFDEGNSVQFEIARNHIQQAHQMFLCWSDHAMDELGRAARVIEVLSDTTNLSCLKEFDSHGGANSSILEDAVQTAKEIREGMEVVALGNSASQYVTPSSSAAESANKGPADTSGSRTNLDYDGLDDLDFDWNLLDDLDTTQWNAIFEVESMDVMFNR